MTLEELLIALIDRLTIGGEEIILRLVERAGVTAKYAR